VQIRFVYLVNLKVRTS